MSADRAGHHGGLKASGHDSWMWCSLAWTFLGDGVSRWNKASLTHRVVDGFPDTKDGGLAISSDTCVLPNVDTWHTDSIDWCRSDLRTRATTIAVWTWAEGNSGWQSDCDRSSSWADRDGGGDSARLSMSGCCEQSCKRKTSHGSFLHCEI